LPRFILLSALGKIALSSCGWAVAVSLGLILLLKIFFNFSIIYGAYHLASMIFDEAKLPLYAHILENQGNECDG
jgi:hypothetical protein